MQTFLGAIPSRRKGSGFSMEGMESHAEPAHLKPEFGSRLPVKEKKFFLINK